MNLRKNLAGLFGSSVRDRGERYLWQGRVRVQSYSANHVKARVRGSQDYNVSLRCDDGTLFATCECAYFDSGPCKHLWATIVAADTRGYLADAASATNFVLDREDAALQGYFEGYDLPESHFSTRMGGQRAKPRAAAWKRHIGSILQLQEQAQPLARWPAKREIIYVVDVPASWTAGGLVLSLETCHRKTDGNWTQPKPLALKFDEIAQLPRPEDREILAMLGGCAQYYSYGYSPSYLRMPSSCLLAHPLARGVLPRATRTGRCYMRPGLERERLTQLNWDESGAWEFELEMRHGLDGGWTVFGHLRRGEEVMDLSEPTLLTQGGFVFFRERVGPLAEGTPFRWITYLRSGPITAPEKDRDELLSTLLGAPGLPPLVLPDELRFEQAKVLPKPGLRVRSDTSGVNDGRPLQADLSFQYEGRLIRWHDRIRGFYEPSQRRFIPRDANVEEAAQRLLQELGVKLVKKYSWGGGSELCWQLSPKKLPRVARGLLEAGWHLEAEGKIFRRPGAPRIEVVSGVDWFELHGAVSYGETEAKLPQLLEALRRGESMVRLDDGTYGMLPEEWLRRLGPLAGLGKQEDSHIQFRRSQAGLLDALLATQPEARCDETFTRLRDELQRFDGVKAVQQPEGFAGKLRDYQCEGLGWMEFLRRFSFGGCLADDMGVGKTTQVLALLETRRAWRASGEQLPPSLVVVPRSLVFNWKEEAARFTPQLRVLDFTGAARNTGHFLSHDVVITTYGTLRREAWRLKDIDFDYVVLDEAQAIKNAQTESAKAVRLLRGTHRLALSGTPVENHLGELWSLFEFLNPGMLGAASVFKVAGIAARKPGDETCRLLAQALRPFILRRTKDQVARELPSKTEQTIHCEMKSVQRQLYDELRTHYREALLKRIETEGLAKSKIQVLEALLRLRQAACHPGLLDPARRTERSAKLDTLLEQLREVIEEGHKALVFSQFTSLLGIVRNRLDRERITYEYLDGATRDRQTRVERFQNDADCPLFLISLRAGGLGLNLTAAEYVFLLDPWWNPAVETQAMDRAHRIGQTRQVFVYRLIARDTVEEKVLELQKTKRDLAAAIISADNSLIRTLQREDLELLLS